MMNCQQFLHKEVINKNNEKGQVLSFDENHIVIKYTQVEKTYNPDIAFKNGFLTFIDESLNNIFLNKVSENIKTQEEEQKLFKKNHEIVAQRHREILKAYRKLKKKNEVMKTLFGGDFVYPPYAEFMKKYEKIVPRQSCIYLPPSFFKDY